MPNAQTAKAGKKPLGNPSLSARSKKLLAKLLAAKGCDDDLRANRLKIAGDFLSKAREKYRAGFEAKKYGGVEMAAVISAVHDDLLKALFLCAEAEFTQNIDKGAGAKTTGGRMALCAVGGYGRGELHPHSDIDLLILLGEDCDSCTEVLSNFLTLLWDTGLNIGPSVRDLDECIQHAAGDITILTSLMEARVIRGPGTHRVATRGRSTRSTFAAVTRQRSAARVRTGATRGDVVPPSLTSPNIWWVDVSKSGTMCVSDLSAVSMWRPGRELASTYVIASETSAEHVHVAFAANEMVATWDGDRLPLTEGASYTITGPSGSEPSVVTFTQIETPPDKPEDLALALLEKGCTTQVDLLAETLM